MTGRIILNFVLTAENSGQRSIAVIHCGYNSQNSVTLSSKICRDHTTCDSACSAQPFDALSKKAQKMPIDLQDAHAAIDHAALIGFGYFMTMHGPTSQYFISQRMRLHFADWGNHEAPPLLLVHGGRDHCRSWDWVAEQLRDKWHVIAVDQRGHGDSQWAADGNYASMDLVYDLSHLIHLLDLAPVTIVAHSMGGNVSLRYTGMFPDKVRKLVAIEGLGPSPEMQATLDATSYADRVREWMGDKRKAAARLPKRYASLEEAYARMKAENGYLTDEQARHLTEQGVNRNEDGTFTWKFDPHLNFWSPFDIPREEVHALWKAISCPTLLLYGANSWASNPQRDGRIQHFGDHVRVEEFENAGHWLHHDQFDRFMAVLNDFL
jgi:pimeloyl-ACP methyl ester carboxylesterase